jgi:hypothetical protein
MRNEGESTRWGWSRWALPVAGLALAVGYVELRREGPAPAATPAVTRASTSRAEGLQGERISALERDVRLLRVATNAQAARAEHDHVTPSARPEILAEEEPEGEEMSAAERQQVRQQQIAADRAARTQFLKELDVRVDSEPVDPKWRAATQGQIAASFSKQLGPDVSIAASICASTLCRVELDHPAQRRLPLARLTELAMHRGEELGAMEIHYDTKSRDGATTIYLLRPADEASSPSSDG